MKLNKRLAVSLLTACMLTSSFAPAVLAADTGAAATPNGGGISTYANDAETLPFTIVLDEEYMESDGNGGYKSKKNISHEKLEDVNANPLIRFDFASDNIPSDFNVSVGLDDYDALDDGTVRAIYPASILSDGTHNETVSFTLNETPYEIPISFTVGDSTPASSVAVTASVDNSTVTYGDSLTINATVTGADDDSNSDIYFYYGDKELGSVTPAADDDGNLTASLTYETKDKKLALGKNTITVKYGDDESTGTCDVYIHPKPVGLNKIASDVYSFDKVFDNTTDFTITDGYRIDGVLENDDVDCTVSCTTETANVGKTSLVDYSVVGHLTGTDAEFYEVSFIDSQFSVNIIPATVTLSADKTTDVKAGDTVTLTASGVPTGYTSYSIVQDTDAGDTATAEDLGNGSFKLPSAGTYTFKVQDDHGNLTSSTTITAEKAASTTETTQEKYTANYGDTISMTVNVQKSPVSTLSADALEQNKAYFYYENKLLGEADVTYADDGLSGTATFTYDTKEKTIPAGSEKTITVKYGGGVNLEASDTTCTVEIDPLLVGVHYDPVTKVFDNTTSVTSGEGTLRMGENGDPELLKNDRVGVSKLEMSIVSADVGVYKYSSSSSGRPTGINFNRDTLKLTGEDAGFYKIFASQIPDVTITPAPVTLSADKTEIKTGETVTLTASGIPEGYVCTIVQTAGTAKAELLSDGSYKFPAAGTYTFSVQEPDGKENLTVNTVTITVKDPVIYVPVDPSDSFPTHKDGWSSSSKGDSYYVNGVKVKGWQTIGGETYYFNEKGFLQTGWLKEDNNWYYLDKETGAMHTGWLKDGNVWYYLDTKTGVMKTGWLKEGNTWYYLNSNGSMKADSWLLENGVWYHFGGNGAMAANRWLYEKGNWYYFGANGAMIRNNWNYINGKWYYFGSSGAMFANTTTPDGYTVDSNGVWNG